MEETSMVANTNISPGTANGDTPEQKKRRHDPTLKPQANDYIDELTKRLQTVLAQPAFMGYMRSSYSKGVKDKLLKIDQRTIRNIIDRVPLISAVINVRTAQVKRFLHYIPPKETGTGFEFFHRNPDHKPTQEDIKVFNRLASFLNNTGYEHDDDREDDFSDFIDMLVRDELSIDEIATELQRNRRGDVIAFWALDGATIKRIDPEEFNKNNSEFQVTPDIRYAQVVEGRITNLYAPRDIIYDFKNRRSDIKFRQWGYSQVEQSIDIITTLLFGYTYLRDQLMRDRVPKGFITVMGDVQQQQLDTIRDYWYAAMSGAGGQWSIPIVPSGKDGIGIDWKSIAPNNRDMEYHKLMMFITSVICAVFNIDAAELGLKTDDSSSLSEDTGEVKIKASKDRGLVDLLSFVEHHINKIIHRVEPEYGFRFVGIDQQSEKLLADIRNIDLTTHRTIDELRAEDGEEPLNEEWSKIVLNTNAVQLILADKAQKLQEKQMAQQAAMGGPPSGPGAGHPMTSQKTGTGGGAKNKSTGDSDLFKYTDGQEQTVDEKEAKQFGKLRKAMRDGTVTISIK
jgi:hypothetical protein